MVLERHRYIHSWAWRNLVEKIDLWVIVVTGPLCVFDWVLVGGALRAPTWQRTFSVCQFLRAMGGCCDRYSLDNPTSALSESLVDSGWFLPSAQRDQTRPSLHTVRESLRVMFVSIGKMGLFFVRACVLSLTVAFGDKCTRMEGDIFHISGLFRVVPGKKTERAVRKERGVG